MPLNLKEIIGHEIHIVIEFLGPQKLMVMKLHNVEDGGIWVESQTLTEVALDLLNAPAAPKTIVIFLPWNQVRMIFGFHDAPSLSERRLGL